MVYILRYKYSDNMMYAFIRKFRTPITRSFTRRNFSNYNNILDMRTILHDDFDKIQQLKNDHFHLPFVVTEIPPPFCPKCNKYAKNDCSFSLIQDASFDDFDLAANPKLTISCPIFGEVSTIFDNDVLDETSSKKDE